MEGPGIMLGLFRFGSEIRPLQKAAHALFGLPRYSGLLPHGHAIYNL